MQEKIDHEYTDFPVCPHCGNVEDDLYGFEDSGKFACGSCGEEFHSECEIFYKYSTSKIG